ncbi:MAG: lipocalin family protein [Parvularculaceae bacterium]
MILRCAAALAATGLVACASPPVNRDQSVALTTADSVDLDRYLGRWYEIARFENSFETNCAGVTADYSRRADGSIGVLNTCRERATGGKARTAGGRAKAVDEAANARLKVSFFGPFWGDYWILWRADDYSVSLVGEPSGRYLWILARTPIIGADVRAGALERLERLGYDVSQLTFTAQPPQPDNPPPR